MTEVEVIDPMHPLFGRRFALRSLSAPLHTPAHVFVAYREYMTLRLPLAATTLAAPRPRIPTKLTHAAVTDLLALTEAWELPCPIDPTSSGSTSPATSASTSTTTCPPSSVR